MIRSFNSQQQVLQSERQLATSHQRATHRKPVPNLLCEADIEAATRWRQHLPCTDTMKLPADLVLQDDSYERHAYEHGAFIGHLSRDITGNAIVMGIWGGKEQVAAAKKAIMRWSQIEHKADRQQKFHKLASLSPQERRRKEKEYKFKVRHHRFRQLPPIDMGFEAIGSFHWPIEEYPPEEVFGKSLEALDIIRMECSCYVSFIHARSAFQVCGRTTNVQDVLNRLRKTYFQIVARTATFDYTRTYVLYWPTSSSIPSHVILERYHLSAIISSTDTIKNPEPALSPRAHWTPRDAEGILKLQRPKNAAPDVIHVSKGIMQTLSKIHYYRGHVEVRLHLGKFLLNQYEKPKDDMYTFEKFESMIRDTQFVGSVTDEVGDRTIEGNILTVLQSCELLRPVNLLTEERIAPNYSAIFIFSDPFGNLRLEVTWLKVDNISGRAQYELGDTKWARLDRDSGTASKLHNVSLTDLHTGSAWEFQIEAFDILDINKLPTRFREFTSKLRLKSTNCFSNQSDPVIELPPVPKPSFYCQQKTYEFGIRDSKYLLHLTQFQDHTIVQKNPLDQHSSTVTREARWALSISLPEWKMKLSENARLPIGRRAEWSDKESDWFPDIGGKPESGFVQLIHKLEALTKHIYDNSSKLNEEDDLMETYQGMTVG